MKYLAGMKLKCKTNLPYFTKNKVYEITDVEEPNRVSTTTRIGFIDDMGHPHNVTDKVDGWLKYFKIYKEKEIIEPVLTKAEVIKQLKAVFPNSWQTILAEITLAATDRTKTSSLTMALRHPDFYFYKGSEETEELMSSMGGPGKLSTWLNSICFLHRWEHLSQGRAYWGYIYNELLDAEY